MVLFHLVPLFMRKADQSEHSDLANTMLVLDPLCLVLEVSSRTFEPSTTSEHCAAVDHVHKAAPGFPAEQLCTKQMGQV